MTPDATGDALVATNPGWSRVAKGTAGQVLRSNGTTLVTANPRNEDLTTNYRFSAQRTGGNQVLTSGAATVLLYDAVEWDPNSNYATGTGIYTVPVTGYYLVTANADASSSADAIGTAYILAIVVNGTEKVRGQRTDIEAAGIGPGIGMVTTGILSLTAADTLKITFFQNAGGNRNAFSGNSLFHFSAHLLSV